MTTNYSDGWSAGFDAARKQFGWQPIETAPLDETSVDLWVEWNNTNIKGEGQKLRLTNCFYCPDEKCWYYMDDFNECASIRPDSGIKVLYWKAILKP